MVKKSPKKKKRVANVRQKKGPLAAKDTMAQKGGSPVVEEWGLKRKGGDFKPEQKQMKRESSLIERTYCRERMGSKKRRTLNYQKTLGREGQETGGIETGGRGFNRIEQEKDTDEFMTSYYKKKGD